MNLWIHKFNKGHTLPSYYQFDCKVHSADIFWALTVSHDDAFLRNKGLSPIINSFLLPFFLLLFYNMTGSWSYLMLLLRIAVFREAPAVFISRNGCNSLMTKMILLHKSMFLPFQWSTKTAKTLNTFSEGCTVSSNEHQKNRNKNEITCSLSPKTVASSDLKMAIGPLWLFCSAANTAGL